ncbi:MAG: helix-turn-helix domain-containing protein [Steroidobacteraceae bacterium]
MIELYTGLLSDPTFDCFSAPGRDQLLRTKAHQPVLINPPKTKILRALGIVLQRFRSQTRHNQVAVAARAGVDPSYLSSIECGRSNPTLHIMSRLAKALRVHAHSLIQAADILLHSDLREAALKNWLENNLEWTVSGRRHKIGVVFAADLMSATDAARERWPAYCDTPLDISPPPALLAEGECERIASARNHRSHREYE